MSISPGSNGKLSLNDDSSQMHQDEEENEWSTVAELVKIEPKQEDATVQIGNTIESNREGINAEYADNELNDQNRQQIQQEINSC